MKHPLQSHLQVVGAARIGRAKAAQREDSEHGKQYYNVDGFRHCSGDRADSGDYQGLQEMIINCGLLLCQAWL